MTWPVINSEYELPGGEFGRLVRVAANDLAHQGARVNVFVFAPGGLRWRRKASRRVLRDAADRALRDLYREDYQ